MDFLDFADRTINMSFESWEHIQERHPEVTKAEIERTLLNPSEVRQSKLNEHVLLYYCKKITKSGKSRLTQVVVKLCKDGNFISTAMTTNRPKSGQKVIYVEKELE